MFIPPFHLFFWLTGKRVTCKLLLISRTQLIRIDLRTYENKCLLLLPSQCGDAEECFPLFHVKKEVLINYTAIFFVSLFFFFLPIHHFYPQTTNPLNTPKETNTHITTHRKWCQVAAVRVEGGVHPRHPSPMPWSRPADPCDPPATCPCQQPLSSLLAPPHYSSASRKWNSSSVSHTYSCNERTISFHKQKNIS